MKTRLIATETWTEIIPAGEFEFVSIHGTRDGSVTIPEQILNYYKGQRFTARNKRQLNAALATGKWEIER